MLWRKKDNYSNILTFQELDLTSLIVKWLKKVKTCKIIMILLLNERLGYVVRKDLLIDLTPIILKWLWEEKMFFLMMHLVVICLIFNPFIGSLQRG
jgi:hypothetical protein